MSRLSPPLETELREKVAAHGAESLVDVVVERAEPCYAMVAAAPDDYAATGNTRWGGEPDVPPDWAWPCDGDPADPTTIYSNFVAQINFAELAPLGTPTGLPTSGLLSLFVGEMQRTNVLIKVDGYRFDGDSMLQRATTPDLISLANPVALRPWKIAAVPAVSVPQGPKSYRALFHDLPVSQARLNWSDDWHLYDLESALRRPDQIGQLLGVALAGDMRVDMYRHIHLMHTGRLDWIFKNYWDSMEDYEASIEKWRGTASLAEQYEAMRGDVVEMLAHNDEIARGAAEWQLLLQIDSNEQMGLEIKASDPLYIFIREEDLANGDFGKMVGKIMYEGSTWKME